MQERVLLVDDEPEFLEIMAERMRARDMEVITSTSATEAMSMIASESFDAVIMDFMMPEMDGIEALKTIKEKRPEMQIILLTGHATVQKGVEAMKAGALDFVEKPADLDALSDKIKQAHSNKAVIVQKQGQEMEGVRFFGEMSASISHEIKNVLAIINENAGLLADLVRMCEKGVSLDLQRIGRVATSITRQVNRGDQIVKSMNRFAHSADLPRESVDLAEMVAFIPELAARLISRHHITLHVELSTTPVTVETNRFFLENLVWNCLCQAIAAAVPPRAVTMSVRHDGNYAAIRFSGLSGPRLSENPDVPNELQTLMADVLGTRVHVDAAAGTLSILFDKLD
jgi:DNA-binding response OmpR family regulator